MSNTLNCSGRLSLTVSLPHYVAQLVPVSHCVYRVMECDLHMLGIKLSSQRLIQRPDQVLQQIQTLSAKLTGPQLSALMHAFPERADTATLERFQAKRVVDLWRGVDPTQTPLTKTERFIFALHCAHQAKGKTELLLNMAAMPGRELIIEEQIRALEHSFQSLLQSTQLLTLLRIVRVVASALNKENIKGFELVSLSNLADTRCAMVSADLLDYVAFAAPRGGVNLK